MHLLKTMVVSEDGIYSVDSVKIDGCVWIVPEWLDGYPSQGFSKPKYMIRVSAQDSPSKTGGNDLVLSGLLPKCVLLGEPSEQLANQYEIRRLPDLFLIPKTYRRFTSIHNIYPMMKLKIKHNPPLNPTSLRYAG